MLLTSYLGVSVIKFTSMNAHSQTLFAPNPPQFDDILFKFLVFALAALALGLLMFTP
jgi:hypothetical protein